MAVLLIRHAKAGQRDRWLGDDRMRPLSPRGKGQAECLVQALLPYAPTRLLSSPFVRCVQTLEPLGALLGVAVEETDDLAEGNYDAADRLMARLAGTSVAVCSHGDIIPHVLERTAQAAGIQLPKNAPCAKGSVWVLDLEARTPSACYLAPAG